MAYTLNLEDQQATSRPAVAHTLTFSADANHQSLWDALSDVFSNHIQPSGLPDAHNAAITDLSIGADGQIAGTIAWTW